jgi:ribonuclease E
LSAQPELGENRRELSRDMAYLLRLWRSISKKVVQEPAPVAIFEESDLIIRTIRDVVTGDVDSIIVDQPEAFERAKSFLSLVMPKYVDLLKLYDAKEPLFHKYNLEEEIANIYKREVPLHSGGSIVIDQTEALVAIDVNTGNFRSDGDAEETAFRLNLIAAKEIARQLRLRDLGGVIVNDFIDMRHERHRIKLEKTLHEAVQRDRARTRILRTSPFGLIEMTRQRMGVSVKRHSFQDCRVVRVAAS